MKISDHTKATIFKFLTTADIVHQYKTDYSISLVYNNMCFPKILRKKIDIGNLGNIIRGIPLNIDRCLLKVSSVLKTIKDAPRTKLAFYSVDNSLRYFIGCGCIFNDKLDPVLLSYCNKTDLFGRQHANCLYANIYINASFINNNNKLNNFISKKIIPVATIYKHNVTILDDSKMRSLVFKPNNVGTDKNTCWHMINLRQ